MTKKVLFIVFLSALIGWSCVYDKAFQESSFEKVSAEEEMNVEKFKIVWHWENKFNRIEVAKVKNWLSEVYSVTNNTLGVYPFDIHFYIHRSKGDSEPVPWAHTVRNDIQGIHFHINPDFELQDFLNDWTAPHEISHLSIPFVGKENSWFSEGYATYMQVRILQYQGVYSIDYASEKYESKFAYCKLNYQSNKPMVEVVDSLLGEWNYPGMYWGGASFFWKLNRDLKIGKGTSLLDVIKKYEQCCRVDESSPKAICSVLDSISGSDYASELLIQYQTQPAYLVFEEFE